MRAVVVVVLALAALGEAALVIIGHPILGMTGPEQLAIAVATLALAEIVGHAS